MRFLLIFILFCVQQLQAQEFTAAVTINTPKLQVADPKIFRSLKTAITEFMNNRKWTTDDYLPEERIEINIIITIEKENSPTNFDAQLTIQAARPIYKSSYNSVLLQHLDKDINFTYGEFEVLDFTENSYTSNLTSILAFYAYVILGLDYDSFAELGGDTYFQKAQNILNNTPRTAGRGWAMNDGAVDNRSRYWLIENLLNVRVQPMRRAFYQYYLLGLDLLTREDQRVSGLNAIFQSLETMQKVSAAYPASMIIQVFVNMKRDEIINVFSVADPQMKRKVYDVMVKLDGTKAENYKELLK